MGNLYATEPLLIKRLQERLPEDVQVLPAPYLKELQDLKNIARRLPAAFVMEFGGKAIAADADRPRRALRALQSWAVILADRDRTDANTASPVRLSAGELAWEIVSALHGWSPNETTRSLTLSEWLEAIYPGDGVMLLPILFTHEMPRLCG